jgi:hypothetical protein
LTTLRKRLVERLFSVFFSILGLGIAGVVVWSCVDYAQDHTPSTATTTRTTRQYVTTTTNPLGMTDQDLFAAQNGFWISTFSNIIWAANAGLSQWFPWIDGAKAAVKEDRDEYHSHMDYFHTEYNSWLEDLHQWIEDSVYQAGVLYPEALDSLAPIQAAELRLQEVKGQLELLFESQADSSEIQWQLDGVSATLRTVQSSMIAAIQEFESRTSPDN